MRQSQAQIGVISAPICAFYHRSLGGSSIVSVQPCPFPFRSGPFWGKSGSDTVRPHPLQQRLVVHRAEGDSKTDLDDLIISAVQPNTVDLQSGIDLY